MASIDQLRQAASNKLQQLVGRFEDISERYNQPLNSSDVRFTDIARPAFRVGQALTGAEQRFGRFLGYYGTGQAQRDVRAFQQDVGIRQAQAQQAAEMLKQPGVQRPDVLQDIIQRGVVQPGEQGINPEFQATPKEIAGAALGTGLDIVTGGSMGAGLKQAATKIPRFGRFMLGGAGLGAGYGTAASLEENLSGKEAAKTIGAYTAGGAAAGAAMYGAGKIVNKLSNRIKIYNALKKAGAENLYKQTKNIDSSELVKSTIDDAVAQLSYRYGNDAADTTTKLQKFDTSKIKTWDDLTSRLSDIVPSEQMADDVMPHIMTRRIYSADPDFVAKVAADEGIDTLLTDPSITRLPGKDAQAVVSETRFIDDNLSRFTPEDQATIRELRKMGGGPEIPAPSAVEELKPGFDEIAKGFSLNKSGEDILKETLEKSSYQKKTITWDETKDIAEGLGLRASDLVKKKADKLSGSEILAIRDIINQNVDFVSQAQQKIKQGGLTPTVVDDLERKISVAMGQTQELTNKFLEARSAAGRTLNSLKIIANRNMEPANWMAIAQRVRGGQELTDDIAQNIIDLTSTNDRVGLVDYIASLQKASLKEKGANLWKAGLLTSFRTHEANIIGNTAMSGLESVKDIPATVVDWGTSLFTGERTKALAPIKKGIAGAEGTISGIKKGAKYLKTGVDVDDLLTKYDIPRQINYDNPIIQTYVDAVYRSLGAADKVFKTRMMQRSLMEDAIVQAKNAVTSGEIAKEGMNEMVQQLYKNPTNEMVKSAIDAAEYVTLQSKNKLASSISRFKKEFPVLGEFIVPFSKTPANIAKTIVDYSPAGFIKTIMKQSGAFNQKELAEGLGRAITGSSIIGLGALLASKGKMTGIFPEEEGKRNVMYASGQRPQAVKLGDTWVQINRIAPVGNLLVLGAELYEQFAGGVEEGETTGEAAASTALKSPATFGKMLTEQTFLKGLSGTLQAVTEQGRYAQSFAENLVSSMVPNIMGDVARGIDPRLLEEKGTLAEQIQQAAISKVPFATKKVPARKDIFGRDVTVLGAKPGEERTAGETTVDFLSSLFNPFITGKESKNPVLQELKNINASSLIPEKETLEFEGVEGSIKLKPETQQKYTEVTGAYYYKLLKALMSTAAYDSLNKEQKQKMISNAYQKARDIGELYLQKEFINSKLKSIQQ